MKKIKHTLAIIAASFITTTVALADVMANLLRLPVLLLALALSMATTTASAASELSALFFTDSADSSRTRLLVDNTGANATNVFATVHKDDGTALCSDITLVSDLAAGARSIISASTVESLCGAWSGGVRVTLYPESGGELELQSLLQDAANAAQANMTAFASGTEVTAWRVPNASDSYGPSALRIYNTSATATNVLATVYDESGTALCSGITLVTGLAANAVAILTPSTIESACGSTWSGSARVVLTSQLSTGATGPEIALLPVARSVRSGILTNLSSVRSGTSVTGYYMPSAVNYSYKGYLRIYNTSLTPTNVLATVYDEGGDQLCSGVTLVTGLAANAVSTLGASDIETACDSTWTGYARVDLTSELSGGGVGPVIHLLERNLSVNAATFENMSRIVLGTDVTALYVESSSLGSSSESTLLRIYNTSATPTNVVATVYDSSGNAVCSGITLISGLAANAVSQLNEAAIESACDAAWSGKARVTLSSETSPGVTGPAIALLNLVYFPNDRYLGNLTGGAATLDVDGDGTPDLVDNCPGATNVDQLDTDADGVGDVCDTDDDDDGLSDLDEEFVHGTDPLNRDTDGDGLSDGDEVNTFGTEPLKMDTDGDTLPDGYETANDLDPLDAADAGLDKDGDGFTNLEEYTAGSAANDAGSNSGTFTLEAAAWSVVEGQSLTVKVSRGGGTVGAVGVYCRTAATGNATGGGVDYSDIDQHLSWADGVGGSKPCPAIATVDDGVADPNETFGIELAVTGLAHLGSPASATVTLTENTADTDADGIPDTLDSAPDTQAANACSGTDAVLGGTIPTGAQLSCRATGSITVTARVESGALLALIAPTIRMTSGFHAANESQLFSKPETPVELRTQP